MNIRPAPTTPVTRSPAERRRADCPHPHNWFICSCGEEFGNWETPGTMRCYQCGDVCESTDNPARDEWFADNSQFGVGA